jgi:hypothetical protein
LNSAAGDHRFHAGSGTGASETNKNRFGLEKNAEGLFHAGLDRIFKGDNFGGRSTSTIDYSKSMMRRDTRISEPVSLLKTALFDQPCRRDLYCKAIHFEFWHQPVVFGRDLVIFFVRTIGFLKKIPRSSC